MYLPDLRLLSVAKYLFHLKAETRIRLPYYKGSALHGGFCMRSVPVIQPLFRT